MFLKMVLLLIKSDLSFLLILSFQIKFTLNYTDSFILY